MNPPPPLGAVGRTPAALALPYADAIAATPPKVTKKIVSKSYTGSAVEADRWGPLQVRATGAATPPTTTRTVDGKKKTTKKVTRKVTGVTVPVYPDHTDRSVFINEEALPTLVREALQAQSATV